MTARPEGTTRLYRRALTEGVTVPVQGSSQLRSSVVDVLTFENTQKKVKQIMEELISSSTCYSQGFRKAHVTQPFPGLCSVYVSQAHAHSVQENQSG